MLKVIRMYIIVLVCDGRCIFVTGFVKIDPNHTGTEIHFIAEH